MDLSCLFSVQSRKAAVHVYREDWAQALFERLPAYPAAFRDSRRALTL
jgi:hypothetical protein